MRYLALSDAHGHFEHGFRAGCVMGIRAINTILVQLHTNAEGNLSTNIALPKWLADWLEPESQEVVCEHLAIFERAWYASFNMWLRENKATTKRTQIWKVGNSNYRRSRWSSKKRTREFTELPESTFIWTDSHFYRTLYKMKIMARWEDKANEDGSLVPGTTVEVYSVDPGPEQLNRIGIEEPNWQMISENSFINQASEMRTVEMGTCPLGA